MSYQQSSYTAASSDVDPNRRHSSVSFRTKSLMVSVMAIAGSLLLLAGYLAIPSSPAVSSEQSFLSLSREGSTRHHHNKGSRDIPMPAGVNFGSWLSLEDYFYAGPTGAVEVATPDTNKAGVCLPPLHVGQEGAPTWQSETDLLGSLTETVGLAQALKIFHAHRTSFITEHDLQKLSKWGVKHVRVPLSWCFTNANPNDIDPTKKNRTDESTKYLQDEYTCADPYYSGVRWPAIPRSLVTQLLRWCAKYGITASLDLHTYPGATSPGTFSGLWPRPPLFWKHDEPNAENDLGRQLLRDVVGWMEDLAESDTEAFQGLRGISPMNEPSHLAGVFRHTDKEYLPPLPRDQADSYLGHLNEQTADLIPDGPHLRTLIWLRDAVDIFRASKLPQFGKQLHVNVHESFLSPEVLSDPNDGDDMGGRHPSATGLIAGWWSRTTTHKERNSWAVLDMHHYHAWEPACMGASDGPPMGNYTCSDQAARDDSLQRCTGWASSFREAVTKHCGKGAQLMSGEFSTSTHHKVRHACNDIDTLRASFLAQLEAAQDSDVELYYWSYKMPFGGAFKSAWSFSQLLYLLGINDRPDESNYNCGEHIAHPLEVTDDIFG